ncbi:MAG: hypothetical protein KAT37_02505 [Candidatus Aenigmarchaeota archaeon]|nr:hypothetical protein [Candidatus Aenigmarchaeota archaeon]
MLGKKGQSALEYLMTYGWAILIIIIVGGVLYYYGVFSPGKLVGESKVGFSKVQLDTWTVDAGADELLFILENRAGKEINITNFDVGGTNTDAATYWTTTWNMAAGDRSTNFVNVTSPSIDAGESYKWDITITYYMTEYGSGTTFTSSGSISGVA